MRRGGAGALGFEMGGIQSEIPFRGAVGVVNQHEMRIVFQAFGLLRHRLRILRDEARAEDANDDVHDGDEAEHIPGSAKIQAAEIAANGRDDGAARKPHFPRANLLEAIAGQREIDCRGDGRASDEFQNFVRQAVRRRRVRAHAKARRDGLELLLLLVDAAAASPPPRLVDERAVRGVHQADDAVVHMHGHFGGKMRDAVALAEFRELGRGEGRAIEARRIRRRHVNPDIAVALLARKCAGIDAVGAEFRVRGERGDFAALARVAVEFPAVITALDRFAVAMAVRKRHAAMRAGVTEGEGSALRVASDDERDFEEHCRAQIASANFAGAQGGIPEVPEHAEIGGV